MTTSPLINRSNMLGTGWNKNLSLLVYELTGRPLLPCLMQIGMMGLVCNLESSAESQSIDHIIISAVVFAAYSNQIKVDAVRQIAPHCPIPPHPHPETSTMSNGSIVGSRMKYHPKYYLHDGSVSFHVERTLFRVHRYFFERESEYFQQAFEAAGPQGDGHSDKTAFQLNDVKVSEFERLMWVFYNPRYMYDEQPKDHWVIILELATRWKFPRVIDLAVRQLQKLDMEPVERIVTYDKYNLDKSLLLSAYTLLCKQSRRSTEDGKQLGMLTVLKINEAREYAQRCASEQGHPSPTSADAEDEDFTEILRGVFDLSSGSQVGAS